MLKLMSDQSKYEHALKSNQNVNLFSKEQMCSHHGSRGSESS